MRLSLIIFICILFFSNLLTAQTAEELIYQKIIADFGKHQNPEKTSNALFHFRKNIKESDPTLYVRSTMEMVRFLLKSEKLFITPANPYYLELLTYGNDLGKVPITKNVRKSENGFLKYLYSQRSLITRQISTYYVNQRQYKFALRYINLHLNRYPYVPLTGFLCLDGGLQKQMNDLKIRCFAGLEQYDSLMISATNIIQTKNIYRVNSQQKRATTLEGLALIAFSEAIFKKYSAKEIEDTLENGLQNIYVEKVSQYQKVYKIPLFGYHFILRNNAQMVGSSRKTEIEMIAAFQQYFKESVFYRTLKNNN